MAASCQPDGSTSTMDSLYWMRANKAEERRASRHEGQKPKDMGETDVPVPSSTGLCAAKDHSQFSSISHKPTRFTHHLIQPARAVNDSTRTLRDDSITSICCCANEILHHESNSNSPRQLRVSISSEYVAPCVSRPSSIRVRIK